MTATELEAYIHEHLPITRAMGVTVKTLDQTQVAVEAPLAPNINHRRTVFGGSLNSLATVCAWSAVFVFLRRRKLAAEVVVRRSETAFLKPALGAFAASALLPSGEQTERFVHILERKSMARLDVDVSVHSQDELCARFSGEFVAIATGH